MSSLLGKRYYETGANDDDEEDYLSDKFLAEIEQHEQKSKTSGSKTYTQLRKEAQKRKEDRGYTKPRAEREREAREEGLKRNLMTAVSSNPSASTSRDASNTPPPPTHGDNKALAMMLKMGFKPGEALGRKVDSVDTKGKAKATQVMEDSADEEDENGLAGLGARRGLGSSKRKAASPSGNEDFISLTDGLEKSEDDGPPPTHAPKAMGSITGHRIDPIEIQMRSGRSGLGVEEAKRRKVAEAASKESQSASVDDYRSRARSNHSERRAEGQLKSVRETCISLDEREGIKHNHLWLDPMEEYHKERERQLGARSRFRIKEREGLGGEFDEDNEFGDDQAPASSRYKLGNAKRDNLHEEIIISDEEEDVDTEEMEKREAMKDEFLRKSATERLKITLDYLRQRHHYCFWCGTAYASAEQLADECPGEEEDDH